MSDLSDLHEKLNEALVIADKIKHDNPILINWCVRDNIFECVEELEQILEGK